MENTIAGNGDDFTVANWDVTDKPQQEQDPMVCTTVQFSW